MKEYLKIYFGNNIKEQDDKMRKLGIKFPLYSSCYQNALHSVLQYIDSTTELINVDYVDNYRRNADSIIFRNEHNANISYPYNFNSCNINNNEDFYDLYNLCDEYNSSYKYTSYQQSSNIIAFIGKRGSGKSTALQEFGTILSQYHGKVREWNKELRYPNHSKNGYFFHVLPRIDASVLDTKEDLLELIFAEMYQVFKKKSESQSNSGKNDEYFKRIVKEFNEVYQNYHNINHNERIEVLGESVLVKLQNVSSSEKVRKAFGNLVKDFLDILEKEQEDSYLVITVDDIDVNLDKGYEMLEQLHKYLWNPRVIILIAIDFEQMSRICEKRFATSLTIPYIDTALRDEALDRMKIIRRLCKEYLLKILPLKNRIYQPDEEVITNRIWVRKIIYDNFMQKQIYQKTKDYILWKIAERTGIYCDSQGMKKHFFVPTTIRALIAYDKFLDAMFVLQEIEQKIKNEQIELYTRNYQWFHQDIVERMAAEFLDYNQLELFRLILNRDIERRAEYIVVFIRHWILNGRIIREQRLRNNIASIHYSYADLLEQIYRLGQESYTNKSLARCLLAVCSCEMVREYYSYMHGTGEERKEAVKNLLTFRGSTFGGYWFQNIATQGNQLSNFMEYIERGSLANLRIVEMFIMDKELSWIDNLIKWLPCLECFTMLFSNVKDKFGFRILHKWIYSFEFQVAKNPFIVHMEIRSNAATAAFDMFGFIGKELEELETVHYKEIVKKGFISAIETFLQKEKNTFQLYQNTEKLKKQIEEKVNQASIWSKTKEFEDISFPFYNLDLSYNVMKRVRREIVSFAGLYNEENILDYFRKVYMCVIKKLEDQDKFYTKRESDKKEKCITKFAEKFRANPVVNAIIEENILDKTTFYKIFSRGIKRIYIPKIEELLVED